MSISDDQSNVLRGLDQRHPHLQLTNSTQTASTAADTMMLPVSPVVAPSELLHLPVIPSVAASTLNRPRTDTGSRSSTFVAGEPAWTGSTKCDRLLSIDTTDDRSKRDVCGGNGCRKSKELVRISVDETYRTSPRPAEHVRNRSRQSGFYCDDERVIRNRLTRTNWKASFDNQSKTLVPFGATKYETSGETRYPGYVPEPRLYRYGPEVSVNSITAAGNRKNRMPGKFYNRTDDAGVRPPQCLTQSQLVKTAVRQINARQTDPRHKQPFRGKTSASADSDEQRQRILDWLDSVSDVGQPLSPDIDDSPTPTQTDTAIHIVYDRE